ncbi:hypothetical protein [Streptomyces sp. 142MFCol3.1]|uniref:hypothetical protein n=1 Tax=Streptomyces sp. 142MFCol3.1 TaxID=1172179 RepID=UPI00041F3ED8|nr:hypothetical protein [Streptomyces sp. 142MFCol3.1]
MATAKRRYSLTWTDPDGAPQASAGRYDKRAAARRRRALEEIGCTCVELVVVKPGELPEPAL